MAQMRVEETRLFHVAVTRARRGLLVTAVRDDDHQPSAFLDLVDPPSGDAADGERPLTVVPRAMALRAVVAELRQVVTAPPGDVPETRRHAAARELARLAQAGVRGAHPDEWYGVAPLSDDGPLRAPDAPVTVSPSRVEGFTRCALRWLLESSGGTALDSVGQSLGNLVHEVAATLPAGSADELRAELERLWPALGLDEGWTGEAEHRRAVAMVGKLADYVAAHERELVAVEQDFATEVGRARLHGRVDRLERDADGRLVVVDLKTGKGSSKPSRAELPRHAQLGVYQLAVEHGAFDEVAPGERRSGGAALVQLGDGTKSTKPQEQAPLADDGEPTWARDLVLRVADGMAGPSFPATDNSMCRVCPARRCCPLQSEGRSVTS
jgi:RecB family exonuclease